MPWYENPKEEKLKYSLDDESKTVVVLISLQDKSSNPPFWCDGSKTRHCMQTSWFSIADSQTKRSV
jgi:hypothetical protein